MGIEISSGGVSKTYRYYPYNAFYVDANGNINTNGDGQQVKEAWFNGVKYYPDGMIRENGTTNRAVVLGRFGGSVQLQSSMLKGRDEILKYTHVTDDYPGPYGFVGPATMPSVPFELQYEIVIRSSDNITPQQVTVIPPTPSGSAFDYYTLRYYLYMHRKNGWDYGIYGRLTDARTNKARFNYSSYFRAESMAVKLTVGGISFSELFFDSDDDRSTVIDGVTHTRARGYRHKEVTYPEYNFTYTYTNQNQINVDKDTLKIDFNAQSGNDLKSYAIMQYDISNNEVINNTQSSSYTSYSSHSKLSFELYHDYVFNIDSDSDYVPHF